MTPPRARDLLGLGLLALLVLFSYERVRGTVGQPPTAIVVTVGVAGVGILVAGSSLATRLSGRPGSKPILPIAVARLAALGIASACTGAIVGGGWAGLLLDRLLRVGGNTAARHDAVVAGLGVVTGLLLCFAGERLQRLCRSPGGPFSG